MNNTKQVKQTQALSSDRLDYYVHERLREWAQWHLKCVMNGLGYPSLTVEGRLYRDGGLLPKSTAPLTLPTNPDAEQMDELINELASYDKALAEAIKVKYMGRHTLYQEAKLRQIPLPTLKHSLRLAKTWLAAKLH